MQELLRLAIEFLWRHRFLRSVMTALSSLLLLTNVWIFFGIRLFPSWYFRHFGIDPVLASEPLIGTMAVLAVICGICLLSYSESVRTIKLGGIELELEPLHKEREEIRQRIKKESKPNVLDIIQLSLNQISEYYAINKSQARRSFAFSVFSVVTGLITILTGIWLSFLGKAQVAVISASGGVLLQFIGGASFYIYNRSLTQLNYFYETLIRTQDTMLSIQLCDELDEARQDGIREKLILEIVTRTAKIIVPGDSPHGHNENAGSRRAPKRRTKTKTDAASPLGQQGRGD
jgi:hypothetical protein